MDSISRIAIILLFLIVPSPAAFAADWPPPTLLVCSDNRYSDTAFLIFRTDGRKSQFVRKNSGISAKEKCDVLAQLAQEIDLKVERISDTRLLIRGSVGRIDHDGETYISPRECLRPIDIGLEGATPFSNIEIAKTFLSTRWMQKENTVPLNYMKIRIEDTILLFALYNNCIVDSDFRNINDFLSIAFKVGTR